MNYESLKYLFSLPPEEIVRWYKSKGYTFSWNWQDTWKEAHSKAFTVAKVMKLDILQELKDEVDKIFTQGITYEQFRKDLEPTLKRLGWWGKMKASETPGYDPASGTDPNKIVQLGSPERLRTIFRTNSNVAYNAGRYKFQMQNAAHRPYWLYMQLERKHKRKAHAVYADKVFMFNDPIWDKIYPPNGFNCFPEGTLVATKEGWTNIEDIFQGQFILGGSGKERLVYKVFRRKFNGDLIRFITKDGSASSSPNHRILTLRGWIRAENLKVGDILVQIPEIFSINKRIGEINHSNSTVCNSTMPAPVKGESSVGNTLNTKFDLRQQNINPIWRYIKVKNRFKSGFIKMIDKDLLDGSRFHTPIRMAGRIDGLFKKFSLAHFTPNFITSRRSILLKFFSKIFYQFAIILGKPFSWMLMCFKIIFHKLFSPYCLFSPSYICINPLGLNSFTSLAGLNSKMFHKSHNSSDIHSPFFGNHINTQELIEVKEAEGFASGAPLDFFDSLQSFRTWARSHCILSEVIDITNIQYNGILYNLGVDTDETYLIYNAVVHNCGCYVVALTKEEVKMRGLKVWKGSDVRIDVAEGWDYNPGKEEFKPDLSKYDPKIAAYW